MASDEDGPGLRREIGPARLALYGLGTMVGAGIWVLVGQVAADAGLVAPLAFVVAAVAAAFTGVSYAALAGAMPEAGGEVVYVRRAFGRRWLAGVTGWAVAATGVVSAATLASGFAGYFEVLLPWPQGLVIALLVGGLAALAILGIGLASGVAATLTVISVGALLWLVGARIEVLADFGRILGAVDDLGLGLGTGAGAAGGGSWLGVVVAASVAFYAFVGFEDMVNVAEEVHEPRRTLPLGIGGALVVATVLYVLVTAVAVLAVAPATLAEQSAPLAFVMGRGEDDPVIAVAGLLAVTNSALAQIVMASRILLGLARQDAAPGAFARIGRTGTPWVATLAVAAVVFALALSQGVGTLARLTSAILLAVFSLVNVAALVLRRAGGADGEAELTLPIAVPACGLVVSLGLLAAAIGDLA